MQTKTQPKLAIESLPDVIFTFRALNYHVGAEHPLTMRFRDAIKPITMGELDPEEAVTLDIIEENIVLDSLYARLDAPDYEHDGEVVPNEDSLDYAYADFKLKQLAQMVIGASQIEQEIQAAAIDRRYVTASIPVNDYSNLNIF